MGTAAWWRSGKNLAMAAVVAVLLLVGGNVAVGAKAMFRSPCDEFQAP